ncbi:MAG TPA: hypothetical protein VEO54_17565 [Thermoanaerobaculia bacterium]|nr:hypothetical protein [Thermoanaerobaculia bacterium]
MDSFKRCTILFLLALAAVPAFAADLVTVETHVSSSTASPNGANQGEVLINNIVNADVRVRLEVQVVYANGVVQRLTGLNDPGVLPPGGGYMQSIFFVIPPDAPPGPATFVASVTASSAGQQEKETSSASFDVIP